MTHQELVEEVKRQKHLAEMLKVARELRELTERSSEDEQEND